MIKNIILTPEDTIKLMQIDSSIQHWSTEHTKAVLTAQDMSNSVRDLYAARNQTLNKIRQDAGIDDEQVEKAVLTPGSDPSSIMMVIHLRENDDKSESSDSTTSS